MLTDRKVATTFAGAIVVTLAGCALFLTAAGSGDENIRIALRLTARIAFLTLLIVFVARPLRQMFRNATTAALLRYRPLIGVAFAGTHTAHLLMIVYRSRVVADFELRILDNLAGVLTYLVIFAMVVTTFSTPRRAVGPRAWRILHKTGLYWVTAVFAQTQLPPTLNELEGTNWWLAGLFATALIVRLTTFLAVRAAGNRAGG